MSVLVSHSEDDPCGRDQYDFTGRNFWFQFKISRRMHLKKKRYIKRSLKLRSHSLRNQEIPEWRLPVQSQFGLLVCMHHGTVFSYRLTCYLFYKTPASVRAQDGQWLRERIVRREGMCFCGWGISPPWDELGSSHDYSRPCHRFVTLSMAVSHGYEQRGQIKGEQATLILTFTWMLRFGTLTFFKIVFLCVNSIMAMPRNPSQGWGPPCAKHCIDE